VLWMASAIKLTLPVIIPAVIFSSIKVVFEAMDTAAALVFLVANLFSPHNKKPRGIIWSHGAIRCLLARPPPCDTKAGLFLLFATILAFFPSWRNQVLTDIASGLQRVIYQPYMRCYSKNGKLY
jgi:hypothetical protein